MNQVANKPIPLSVRQEVLRRAGGRCEDCGFNGLLEVHHRTYLTDPYPGEPEGEPIYGRETANDLSVLCRNCHHARHVDEAGNFWLEEADHDTYWATYWEPNT